MGGELADPLSRAHSVRIGTANLDGRWSRHHEGLLRDLACDVWLLTEVNAEATLAGYREQRTSRTMAPSTYWAAVLARVPLEPEPDPHPATASARSGGIRLLSSVLPWRSCGPEWPGDGLAGKTEQALAALKPALSDAHVIWGGDWNHALSGPEFAGTLRGRRALIEALEVAGLVVPTATLPSARPGHRSIDHIALSARLRVIEARAIPAVTSGRRLSDHDAYVVDVELCE